MYNQLSSTQLPSNFKICAISACRKTAFSGQNVRICSAVRASRGRNRAAVIMQRRPCLNATTAPPEPRKAFTAEPYHFRHASATFQPPFRHSKTGFSFVIVFCATMFTREKCPSSPPAVVSLKKYRSSQTIQKPYALLSSPPDCPDKFRRAPCP